ncbi:MAG: rhomboid family intramembrane serine protease, partial [Omnitrophica bacterium]|nr:rhomboid family intramembrane serine protease [Candidatus Omnitrophota bacterium]
VSYMFLHVGLWHLVMNMLMLWFFGPAIESAWGKRQFLFYYFFTGVGAGLCSFVMSFRSAVPVIGASGAIFGILVAYALMFPETVILLFFVFPMKIKHAVLLLAGMNLLGAFSSPGAGIAYFAHLGGGLFGYLYLRSEWIKRQISYRMPGSFSLGRRRNKIDIKEATRSELDQKVDRVLDKISKHGIDSLTKKEREILELKSKKSSGKP